MSELLAVDLIKQDVEVDMFFNIVIMWIMQFIATMISIGVVVNWGLKKVRHDKSYPKYKIILLAVLVGGIVFISFYFYINFLIEDLNAYSQISR